jgi:hypothetical protein
VCGAPFDFGRGEFTGAVMLAQFGFCLIALYGSWFLTFVTPVPFEWQVAWVLGFGVVLPCSRTAT